MDNLIWLAHLELTLMVQVEPFFWWRIRSFWYLQVLNFCLSFEAVAVFVPCRSAQTHAQVKPRDFVALYRDILVLVMEPDGLKKVEACDDRYDDVMDALHRGVHSSRIGAADFSVALVTEFCAAERNRDRCHPQLLLHTRVPLRRSRWRSSTSRIPSSRCRTFTCFRRISVSSVGWAGLHARVSQLAGNRDSLRGAVVGAGRARRRAAAAVAPGRSGRWRAETPSVPWRV